MAVDRQDSPYRRGNRYDQMPIPMVPEHCVPVDAGAVQLVVESRILTNEIIADSFAGAVVPNTTYDDFGATLHVCGTADGIERLRFDCFENEPHYHYIHDGGGNTVVRIDELAVGDPLEFALGAVERHLPDMLRNCGVDRLADEVAGQPERVRAALTEVRTLMEKAGASSQ